MARKNARRKQRCDRKKRHATAGGAHAHLKSLLASDPTKTPMNVYRCGNHWHIGHRRQSNRTLKYHVPRER